MSEKVNGVGRYTHFRFEDSLRRYQEPPRKRVKLDGSRAPPYCKSYLDSEKLNRLARLCETRKIYTVASREKASQFSKKKQAMQESARKDDGQVSDFVCSMANQQSKENLMSNQRSFAYVTISPDNVNASQKEIHLYNQMSPDGSLNKDQSVNQQIMTQQYQKAKDEQDQKVKDIEFHIALVEELHQKIIDEYQKMECSMGEQLNQLQPIQDRQDAVIQAQEQLRKNQQYDNNSENSQYLQEAHKINQNQPQLSALQLMKAQKPTGRLKIPTEKGEYYLSARVFYKICSRSAESSKITYTIIRHHPQLSNVAHILQELAQKRS